NEAVLLSEYYRSVGKHIFEIDGKKNFADLSTMSIIKNGILKGKSKCFISHKMYNKIVEDLLFLSNYNESQLDNTDELKLELAKRVAFGNEGSKDSLLEVIKAKLVNNFIFLCETLTCPNFDFHYKLFNGSSSNNNPMRNINELKSEVAICFDQKIREQIAEYHHLSLYRLDYKTYGNELKFKSSVYQSKLCEVVNEYLSGIYEQLRSNVTVAVLHNVLQGMETQDSWVKLSKNHKYGWQFFFEKIDYILDYEILENIWYEMLKITVSKSEKEEIKKFSELTRYCPRGI
ncbi:hypothetical protein ODR38_10925, partial [Pediococcus acidilactici]